MITRLKKLFTKTQDKPVSQRRFDAGAINRTLSTWAVGNQNRFDKEIQSDLVSIRSRSRDASINDSYARRYFQILRTNVIGPDGIDVSFQIKDTPTKIDTKATQLVSDAWDKWEEDALIEGGCWTQAQQMFVEAVARDGECIVQIVRGKDLGPQGFQLRFLEPEYLDINYSRAAEGGNVIRNGIEYNSYGKRVAFWMWQHHPYDELERTNVRIRVDAKDIIYGFWRERASQGRGYPWLSSALITLQHVKKYQESELVAARVASAKMGFFTRPKGEDSLGDEVDVNNPNAVIQGAEPGSFDILPEGWNIQTFDPQNPNAQMGGFVKVCLRSVASAGGIAYHTLTNDLESASYSALRQGAIEEREFYKTVQKWVIDAFCKPVFENWLEWNLLKQNIRLPIERFDKYNAPIWRPRTWAWVDPQKETSAIQMQLDYKLRSRTDIIASLGREAEDVFAEIAKEQELMSKLGIDIPEDNPATPIPPLTDDSLLSADPDSMDTEDETIVSNQ